MIQFVLTIVRPEHAVEMLRLLPYAQLAILPGTDHMTLVKHTDWLVSIAAFLEISNFQIQCMEII